MNVEFKTKLAEKHFAQFEIMVSFRLPINGENG
jgi:hypothetical protein